MTELLIILALCLGGLLVTLLLVWLAWISLSSTWPNRQDDPVHSKPAAPPEEAIGDPNMLPQHLLEQISKIIEEKTGVKIPRPKSTEEILASIPAEQRKKLLPVLVPIVVDAIRQSTGMNLDASLALQEFLLGHGLGLTELDVAIEVDKMKIEKTLAARKEQKEIVDHYREELGAGDAFVDFVEKMFLYKLVREALKDTPLPPGWSPQQIAGLLPPPSREQDHQTFNYDAEEDEEE